MKFQTFKSSDTNVSKFVFTFEEQLSNDCLWTKPILKKEAVAEAVLYRYGSYEERTVICCSVQSGCPVGCTFCGTGKFFVRNLSTDEIVKQVKTIMKTTVNCKPENIKKFQIMFMSMGEPMLNTGNLWIAIRRLAELYPNAQLLISTSAPQGMIDYLPSLIQISNEFPQVGIQFSVHESTDEARSQLIPTKTSTLRQIACLGETWAAYTGRRPFFNYCCHSENTTDEDAIRLYNLFNPDIWECTLSVICDKDESVCSSIDRQLNIIRQFDYELISHGFSTRIFNPAGQDDIGGGCGQLWWFQDWLKQNNK